jgi:hypothetical protein
MLALDRPQVADDLGLEHRIVGFAQEMAQQDVFRRNGGVGLQLERPMAVRLLQARQSVRRAGHAGIDASQQIGESLFTGCGQSVTAHI